MKTCLHLLVAFALTLPVAGAMAQNLVVNGAQMGSPVNLPSGSARVEHLLLRQ